MTVIASKRYYLKENMASGLHFLNSIINCLFVGKCFVDIAEEMKEVYAVYCRNHDDAISLVEKVC